MNQTQVKTIFYRLRQVDYNEAFEYSEVRVLNLLRTQALSLNPNPFNDFIEISGIDAEADYEFLILDVQGKQTLSGIVSASQPKIKTDQLPAGIYFIRLSNSRNGFSEVVKIVK